MGLNKKERNKYFKTAFHYQQQRYYDATGKALEHPMCEAELRKITKQTLEPYMKFKCVGRLTLDNIDNYSTHNDPSNHQVLCFSMNCRKNHSRKRGSSHYKSLRIKRIRHSHESKREKSQEWQDSGEPSIVRYEELKLNKLFKPKADRFIDQVMLKRDSILYKALSDSVANHCGCNQQTANRYIDARCAPFGGKYKVDYINREKTIMKRAQDEWEQRPVNITNGQLGEI